MRRWIPLLEGRPAEAVRAEIRTIVGELAYTDPLEGDPDATLGFGLPGFAMALAYAHASGLEEIEPNYFSRFAEWACRVVDEESPRHKWCGLYHGLAGIAWVLQHLRGLCLYDTEAEDIVSRVDQLLTPLVEKLPRQISHDLLSGLAGYGLYFLDRVRHSSRARQAILETVDRLEQLARQTRQGLAWPTRSSQLREQVRQAYPAGYFNLGVAHGLPGVLWILAGAALTLHSRKAASLLTAGVQWLLAQGEAPVNPSVYPDFVPIGTNERRDCRLAWCHGDAGIATTLIAIARSLRQESWKAAATALALRATHRTPETSGVVDPALCHGAAGIAHLFNRAYQSTGEERLAQSARMWFAEALRMRRRFPSTGGYRLLRSQRPLGFLAGSAGISLALSAAVTDREPHWDRLLCASFCHTRKADRVGTPQLFLHDLA